MFEATIRLLSTQPRGDSNGKNLEYVTGDADITIISTAEGRGTAFGNEGAFRQHVCGSYCSSDDWNKPVRNEREKLGVGMRVEKPSEKRLVDSTGSAVPIGAGV